MYSKKLNSTDTKGMCPPGAIAINAIMLGRGGWWQPILPASDIDIKNFANPFPPPPPPAAPVPAPDPVPIGDKKGESWDGSWILQMGGFVLFVAILVFLVMTFDEPEDGWGSDDEECRVEDRGGRIRETCW